MRLTKLAAAIGFAVASSASFSAPIIGDIAWSQIPGTVVSPVGGSLATATGFSFTTNGSGFNMAVIGSSLAGVNVGDYGRQYDFTIAGGASPMWTIGAYTMSISSPLTVLLQSANAVALTAYGTVSAAGYDDTVGKWDFSVNQTGAFLSWSSSAAVPVPASLALIGIGLIAGGLTIRRKQA